MHVSLYNRNVHINFALLLCRQVWGCQGDSHCHTGRVCCWHFTVDSGSDCGIWWSGTTGLMPWLLRYGIYKLYGLPAKQSAMDTLFLWESIFWPPWVINNQLTNILLEFILFANWQMPVSFQKITLPPPPQVNKAKIGNVNFGKLKVVGKIIEIRR